MDLLSSIRISAKRNPKRIAFPEPQDPRVLKAASILSAEKICFPILVGSEKEILALAKKEKVSLAGIKIVDPSSFEKKPAFISKLVELRSSKGVDEKKARELLSNSIYFATMMVKTGDADGLVSGSLSPTSETLRPAFQIIKTVPQIKTASGAFIMVPPPNSPFKTMVFADCAVNPSPSSQELAEIAFSSAQTAKSLAGISSPKIAMLSFSTKGSAEHESVSKVVEATAMAKKLGLDADGELQFDAALIPEVARLKAPSSPVAGKANVFIFPSLESGNIGYKIAERLGHFRAVGPVIQGLAKPVNDLSRGCSVEDIVDLAAITCVQAQNKGV